MREWECERVREWQSEWECSGSQLLSDIQTFFFEQYQQEIYNYHTSIKIQLQWYTNISKYYDLWQHDKQSLFTPSQTILVPSWCQKYLKFLFLLKVDCKYFGSTISFLSRNEELIFLNDRFVVRHWRLDLVFLNS